MNRLLRWLAVKLFSSHAWRLKHGRLLSTLGGGLLPRGEAQTHEVTAEGRRRLEEWERAARENIAPPDTKCAICGRVSSFLLRNHFQADMPVCGGCVVTAAPPTADRIVTVRQGQRRPLNSRRPFEEGTSMVQGTPPWED